MRSPMLSYVVWVEMTSTLLASARIDVKELLNGKVLSPELLVALYHLLGSTCQRMEP